MFPALPDCPLCQQALSIYGQAPGRTGICRRCAGELEQIRLGKVQCSRCGKYMETAGGQTELSLSASKCSDCTRREPPFLQAWNIGPYEGMLRQWIHDLKYRGYQKMARPLGQMLAQRLWEGVPRSSWLNPWGELRGAVIVPIPLHPEKCYRRNFNQASLIAETVCDETGLPLADLLGRRADRTAQAKLGRNERFRNLEGQFFIQEDEKNLLTTTAKKPSTAVIVDDVYTTGATVAEASRPLMEWGVEKIFVLTVAAGIGI
nr:ComF family protein [Heliobacterium chlorum]